ncbi:MAG: PAS domain S-box protein [Candidatus Brocadiaceae bacterium]|nr:PAS domain S-box protein [Candidatus Brocadiaceae bacterium]
MYLSIKNRLILLLVTFTLFPFIVALIVAYPRIKADIQGATMRELDGIVEKQAALVSYWKEERMKEAVIIVNDPSLIKAANNMGETGDFQDLIEYLEVAKNKYDYADVFICNRKGVITASTQEDILGHNFSQIGCFPEALKGNTSLSNIVPSEIPILNEFGEKEVGLPVMFVATPLKNMDGFIVGAVVLRIDLKNLNEMMQRLHFGKTGETYLVNKDGYMITESRFVSHLKDIGFVKKRCSLELKLIDQSTGELTRGVLQCIDGNKGSDAKGYEDYNGVIVLGAWQWLPELDWGIITEIDREEGYQTTYSLNYRVSVVLLAFVLPLALSAYLIGRKTSSPIMLLTELTKKIASGDFTQRVSIKRKDEIGELAENVNLMADSLERKTRDLLDSEKKYSVLFDSLIEGVYQAEPGIEGVFTFVNRAGAEIFGYTTPDEMIGTKVKNIYVDPEDRRRLCEKLEQDGIWREFVSLCKKKDGEHFFTERTTNLLRDETGKPLCINGVFRDISERKKAETAVIESEKRYRLLFDSLKEGVYQSEPEVEGLFTWINQAGAEILGYKSPSEVIGTKVKDIYVNPDDRRKVVDTLNKETTWKEFTSFCKRKNGERFYMERTSNLSFDENGKPIRIEGIFRDVTERKRREEELQNSELYLRQLLNELKEGIYQCEPEEGGVFTWVNKAGAKMLGYDAAIDLVGIRVMDVFVHPDDRKVLIEKLKKEKGWREFVSLFKRKNGDQFSVECAGTLVRDQNDNAIRMICVFRA